MRLVRFEGDDWTAIEFHPRLTVVGGLPDAVRARLIETARALPRGATTGARGAIEVHGVLMQLEPSTLELLELDADVDVVLAADQLPGAEGPLVNGNGYHEPTPRGLPSDPELEEARAELARASRAAQDAQEERSRRMAGEERLSGRIDGLRAEVAANEAQIDPSAAEAVAAARVALDAVEARSGVSEDPEVARRQAGLEKKVRVIAEQHRILRAEVQRLLGVDPSPVRDALARVEMPAADGVASVEAQQLAAEIESVVEQLSSGPSVDGGEHQHLVELTARRDAAYDAFVAAEQQLRTPDLDPTVVERLEVVHDEIFELDNKRSRLGASRNRRRILELKEEEDALLAELGFATWTNYVMGVANADAEAERLRRYEVAKATYEFAEEELGKAATAPTQGDPARAELVDRHRALLDRAAALLGVWSDDPVPALRAHLEGGDADPAAATEALRAALLAQGVAAAGDDLDALVEAARAWLVEADSAESDANEIAGDVQRLEGQLAQMKAELAQIAAPTAGEPPEVTAARAALDDAKARQARHEAAERAVARLRQELSELVARDETAGSLAADAAGAVAQAEAALDAARARVSELEAAAGARRRETTDASGEGAPTTAAVASRTVRAQREARERDRSALEWNVLGRMAQQRSLSFVGSLPLVIDDAFSGWPFEDVVEVLGRIRRMSEVIQVIILTDDVDIARWARELGRDKALVLDLAPV